MPDNEQSYWERLKSAAQQAIQELRSAKTSDYVDPSGGSAPMVMLSPAGGAAQFTNFIPTMYGLGRAYGAEENADAKRSAETERNKAAIEALKAQPATEPTHIIIAVPKHEEEYAHLGPRKAMNRSLQRNDEDNSY